MTTGGVTTLGGGGGTTISGNGMPDTS